MKILGISGSNRKDGNSYLLLKEMLKDALSFDTKIIQIAEFDIKPCELCFESCSLKPFECVIKDGLKEIFEEMKSANGIIFACPFYFYVPAKFQAFLERLSCLDYFTLERHGEGHNPLAGKLCLLISVSASGSSFNAFQILHHLQEFALTLRMRPVITNNWPYIGFSAKSGEIKRGAILKETRVLEQARQQLTLLINEIKK
jgi:multimeric flavodoxin WrbA